MSFSNVLGSSNDPNLPTIFPSLSTKNLEKFHLIASVPINPFLFELRNLKSGSASAPLTFIFANIGNVTEKLLSQNFNINHSFSCIPN